MEAEWHICMCQKAIIGSDNGLSPDRRQAIIWTSAGLLLIGLLETNFCEIWIKLPQFSLKKLFIWKHFQNGGHFVLTLMY